MDTHQLSAKTPSVTQLSSKLLRVVIAGAQLVSALGLTVVQPRSVAAQGGQPPQQAVLPLAPAQAEKAEGPFIVLAGPGETGAVEVAGAQKAEGVSSIAATALISGENLPLVSVGQHDFTNPYFYNIHYGTSVINDAYNVFSLTIPSHAISNAIAFCIEGDVPIKVSLSGPVDYTSFQVYEPQHWTSEMAGVSGRLEQNMPVSPAAIGPARAGMIE